MDARANVRADARASASARVAMFPTDAPSIRSELSVILFTTRVTLSSVILFTFITTRATLSSESWHPRGRVPRFVCTSRRVERRRRHRATRNAGVDRGLFSPVSSLASRRFGGARDDDDEEDEEDEEDGDE